MNYRNMYERIISQAKARSTLTEGYYEIHHIVPRCIGGNNDKENLVSLTAREHLIAHLLLHKIYPTNKKLALAVGGMAYNREKRKLNSRQYEQIKKAISTANTIPIPSKETLLGMYIKENKSYKKIAKHFNVSDMTICKWFRHYNIPPKTKSKYGLEMPPKQLLEQLMEPNKVDRIMSHFNVSRSVAYKWLKKYSLSCTQVVGLTKVKPTKEYLIQLYFEKGLSLLAISRQYNVSRDLVRTWFRNYNIKAIKGRKFTHKQT